MYIFGCLCGCLYGCFCGRRHLCSCYCHCSHHDHDHHMSILRERINDLDNIHTKNIATSRLKHSTGQLSENRKVFHVFPVQCGGRAQLRPVQCRGPPPPVTTGQLQRPGVASVREAAASGHLGLYREATRGQRPGTVHRQVSQTGGDGDKQLGTFRWTSVINLDQIVYFSQKFNQKINCLNFITQCYTLLLICIKTTYFGPNLEKKPFIVNSEIFGIQIWRKNA